VVEKFQPLLDLGNDILRDGAAAGVKGKLAQAGQECGRRQPQ